MSAPVAVAAVTSAAALAAGCGAATDEDVGTSPATRSAPVTSARVDVRTEVEDGGVRPLVSTGEGVYDWKRELGQFAMRSESPEEDYADWKLEIVAFPDAVYMSLPRGVAWNGLEQKRWLESRLESRSHSGPFAWVGGYDVLPVDPGELLEYVRDHSDRVALVGSDDVRGVTATHYRATLDDALSLQLSDGDPQLKRGSLELDLWVDQDSRTRRVRATLPPSESLHVTLDFFDFGVAVDPVRPPADEVMTQEELVKAARQLDADCDDGDSNERAREEAEGRGWTSYSLLCLTDAGTKKGSDE